MSFTKKYIRGVCIYYNCAAAVAQGCHNCKNREIEAVSVGFNNITTKNSGKLW